MNAINGDPADAALIRDTARWHDLEAEIAPLLAVREERRLGLPKEFKDSNIDPRGWREYEGDWPRKSLDRLKELEGWWVRLGLGEAEDQIKSLWDEQDTLIADILDTSPTTLVGTIALAAVCLARLGDDKDEFLDRCTNVAKHALADAQRMLGCAA